jgi:hypothetical protein
MVQDTLSHTRVLYLHLREVHCILGASSEVPLLRDIGMALVALPGGNSTTSKRPVGGTSLLSSLESKRIVTSWRRISVRYNTIITSICNYLEPGLGI